MTALFNATIYDPIYNVLAFLVGIIPGADVGVSIIVLTLLVRLILFPLSLSAIKSQISMSRIGPAVAEIREKYKDDKETLGKKTMELFRENKVNPFASILLVLIQLPIIIGLYAVLRVEAKQVSFNPALLYSFVHAPAHASVVFLGVLNLTDKSLVLAAIVALSQFIYAKLLKPSNQPVKKAGQAASFQDDFASSMQLQMQYVFPILMAGIAYFASSAIALYFVTSNIFSVLQELVVQRIHGKR